MTLEQVTQRIHTLADQLLVTLAEQPESRYLFTLPPLTDEYQEETQLDCQESNYCIARLREVITYKYLLGALKSKLLAVSKENLYACIRAMRTSPVIDYYDLSDYHEYAFYYYKRQGQEKKARAHLLACYFDRGRAILSCDKTFDSKELLLVLMKDHERLFSFLMYVIDFIHHDFEDYQACFKRSHYLLFERVFLLADKIYAENTACDVDLRSSIYHVQSLYYELTKRPELAQSTRDACLKLGGDRNYDELLENLMLTRLNPHWMDERFLDYLLYGSTLEEDEICTRDAEGNITLKLDDEYTVWTDDERVNFMDAYYRQMTPAMNFKKDYDLAEKGDRQAILEIVRRYREGDGVTPCACAADAWEKQLRESLS